MDYSLTFTVSGVTKNTWDDWGMAPSTPPMIAPPEPNVNYVDIPGREAGPIDMSMIPFGKMTYKRMTGSWEFYREPDTKTTRRSLFETLQLMFTGKTGKVVLSEDPNHFFVGRFSVSTPKTSVGPIQFVISYDLEPCRYNLDGTVDESYASTTGGDYYGGGGGSSYGIQVEYDEETQDLRVYGFM